MFRAISAISGHGCHEKPELDPDDPLRAVASEEINQSEQLENPFDGADNK